MKQYPGGIETRGPSDIFFFWMDGWVDRGVVGWKDPVLFRCDVEGLVSAERFVLKTDGFVA